MHGVPPVIAVNAFPTDHASEHAAIADVAAGLGVRSAVCTHFAHGGKGAAELAEAADTPSEFRLLYPDHASLREKIETIAQRIYGASKVAYDPSASRQLDACERNGFGTLVCIAKTHLSISSNPALKGAPTGWTMPVREVRASAGAGFIYRAVRGNPHHAWLSSRPAALHIDLDQRGEVVGLS